MSVNSSTICHNYDENLYKLWCSGVHQRDTQLELEESARVSLNQAMGEAMQVRWRRKSCLLAYGTHLGWNAKSLWEVHILLVFFPTRYAK